MVAFALCAGCATGDHENHAYWIQKPPEGVMGGFACRCSGPEECAGNGEKLLRALFGDSVLPPAPITDPASGEVCCSLPISCAGIAGPGTEGCVLPPAECRACRIQACEIEGNTAEPHTCATPPAGGRA